ncbi:hypothetical protein [Streptomyces daliensis]
MTAPLPALPTGAAAGAAAGAVGSGLKEFRSLPKAVRNIHSH